MLSRLYDTRPDVLSAISESVRTLPPHYLTPPYLSAQPEVTRHLIRPEDKFLVLATDGLWELMHRQTVVQLVGEHQAGQETSRPVYFNVCQKHEIKIRNLIIVDTFRTYILCDYRS